MVQVTKRRSPHTFTLKNCKHTGDELVTQLEAAGFEPVVVHQDNAKRASITLMIKNADGKLDTTELALALHQFYTLGYSEVVWRSR